MYIRADRNDETEALNPIIISAVSLGLKSNGTEFSCGVIFSSLSNFERNIVWFSWKKNACDSSVSSFPG